jgi:hypothetical protein
MVNLDSFIGVNMLKFDEGWLADPGITLIENLINS